jgi:oxygen-independent coproporphyrinogen-3 oxidase
MMEELHPVLSLGAGGVTKMVQYDKGQIRRLSNPKYPQEYLSSRERILAEKRQFVL